MQAHPEVPAREVEFDVNDPEWFVCKEHGHYIDSPEHYYVCGNRRGPVVG